MAGGTLAGRVSLFSRTGKTLLAGAVVLTALAVVVSTVTLYGDDADPAGADASDGDSGAPGDLGGPPRRIEPTALPGDSASPSRSPLPTPSRKPPQKRQKPPQNANGPSYSAWAGPGCTGGGRYLEGGRFNDGDDGWYTVDSGGHRGDGCDGSFTAIPMSGSSTKDAGGTATWSWYVGSGYTSCAIAVTIPESDRDDDVAGQPTTYNVLADPDDEDSAIKSFQIDQTTLRGSGQIVEKVPVVDQQLAVQLVDRGGQDGNDGREGAHHAAAQMRAECRA
ncbi:adhesin [Streptomyces sp. NBC_01142]|uniref:adhesin n=1 Tax=Streptomyces sp. NBC_01142 TaxID=2975865 RepID=UPI002255F499|nr:adhesin [Streptomyces sp. NBC_01142]MCX4823773.1 adhesin [Streptomyces sp. NBC_01142]